MGLQRLNIYFSILAAATFVGCASTSPVNTAEEPEQNTNTPYLAAGADVSHNNVAPAGVVQVLPTKKASDNSGLLICKASRKRIHYDWSAGSMAAGKEMIDQNNIRYEFRSAKRPAGKRGENLKVGECGWMTEALPLNSQKNKMHSQIIFKSLSDEATQTFYKMKTGKVFKVPVRQTKNGLVAAPGGVSILR